MLFPWSPRLDPRRDPHVISFKREKEKSGVTLRSFEFPWMTPH